VVPAARGISGFLSRDDGLLQLVRDLQ